MTYNHENELQDLGAEEEALRFDLLQIVSRRYIEATAFHTPRVPYLQGSATEVGEAAVIFRMDSLATYYVKTENPNVSKGVKERYNIYLPLDWTKSEANDFTDKFWLKRFQPGEKPKTFAIDEQGSRRFTPKRELKEELARIEDDQTPTQIEFDLGDAMAAAILEKQLINRQLEAFKSAMLEGFEIVPWKS